MRFSRAFSDGDVAEIVIPTSLIAGNLIGCPCRILVWMNETPHA